MLRNLSFLRPFSSNTLLTVINVEIFKLTVVQDHDPFHDL